MNVAPSQERPRCDLHDCELVYQTHGIRAHHACPKFGCDRQAVLSAHDRQWRLSNRQTRQARMAAHDAFDQLWRSGRFSRRNAYRWLALEMGIGDAQRDCHVAHFDVAQCAAVVDLVEGMTWIGRRRPALVRGGLNT